MSTVPSTSAIADSFSSTVAERLNYQTNMFLTSAYMSLEQSYFINWFCLQNKYLFTPGVLSGMYVTQNGNALAVTPGVGFDPLGNFLIQATTAAPVSIPTNPSNPFFVYAFYPSTSGATTDVVNTAAQLSTASTLATIPANGIALASVSLDNTNSITAVTDIRPHVTSRLPANLTPNAALVLPNVSLNQALQGTLTVPTTGLQLAGNTTTVTGFYLNSQESAYASPPTVMLTVLGNVPYAFAVVPDLASFAVTVTALQNNSGASSVNFSWVAVPAP